VSPQIVRLKNFLERDGLIGHQSINSEVDETLHIVSDVNRPHMNWFPG
jgi:hypothetical protein